MPARRTAAIVAAALLVGCGGRTDRDLAGTTARGGAEASSNDAASGRSGGADGDDILIPEARSCTDTTGTECNGESCCTSIIVPGGTFPMGRGTGTDAYECTGVMCGNEVPEHAATVATFYLDKFEVTVGRFRRFVNQYGGTPPAAGAGAHPSIAASGWDSAWNSELPIDRATLVNNLDCSWEGRQTWTEDTGANENYPINCVNWYEAFAFCIWDGGRLPAEAEWEYAAAGGSENRLYPWGSLDTAPLPANYSSNHGISRFAVGSEPEGDGRWRHSDLAGGMWEWTLDWYQTDRYVDVEAGCMDCVNSTPGTQRVGRGGSWAGSAGLRAAERYPYTPLTHIYYVGLRCARDVP